jgi:hypothetical protein
MMQATALNYFRIFNTMPDLLLLFVLMLGLFNSIEEGVFFGLAAGVISSMFSTAPPFALCLAYGLSGLMAGIVKDRAHPDLFIIPLLAAIGGSLISSSILIISGLAQGMAVNTLRIYFHLFIFIILNAVLAIPFACLARSGIVTARRPIE